MPMQFDAGTSICYTLLLSKRVNPLPDFRRTKWLKRHFKDAK